MKSVLVTGASGFVGTNFCQLSEDAYQVNCVSLRQTKIDQIDFSEVDVVLHLAGIAHRMKKTQEDLYYSVNRDLTYELAKVAKRSGVNQFIFASTIKVYGFDSTDILLSLTSNCNPKDDYGRSKLQGEEQLMKLSSPDFKVAVVRIPLVYGPGVKGNLNALMKLTLKFPLLPFGGIDNSRSMISVRNLVEYFRCIIEKEFSGVVLPSDKITLSTTELVRLISNELDSKTKLVVIPQPMRKLAKLLIPDYYRRLFGNLAVDSTESNKLLGFTPSRTVEQEIGEMVREFNQQGT